MTVLIKNGVYPIASTSWYPYITANNVVFRSFSGNRDSVILTGTGMKSVSPDVEIGLYAVGNNITIADLTIREVGNHGIATVGDSIFIHNVRVQNTYEQMIKGNGVGDGADYGRVQCSLMEYTAGIGPEYYIGGIDIHLGDHWIVRDNVFKHIQSPSVSVAEHAVHFWKNGSDNTVERNLIINCDRGIGFGLGDSPNTGGKIRNNMIYNDGSGVFSDVGIGLETSPGTKVYNNSIYINYPNSIEYRWPSTVDVDIKNNLCNKLIKQRDGAQANLATNITNAQADWFADVTEGDLHLISNNPLVVDQGSYLVPEVVDDIDQLIRPQGAGFDIGAQEYVIITNAGEVNSSNEISLFPNPVSSDLFIKSNKGNIYTPKIYNLMGELIETNMRQIDKSVWTADCRDLVPGLYFCHIINSNNELMLVKFVMIAY